MHRQQGRDEAGLAGAGGPLQLPQVRQHEAQREEAGPEEGELRGEEGEVWARDDVVSLDQKLPGGGGFSPQGQSNQ